jgi:type II secretory pathway component PulJ
MEVLIAMSLLVVLGGGLATLLSQGGSIWRTAENRGRIYEEARAILERVADDLRSTVIRTHSTGENTWIRFLCDEGPGGRQRLRFVRTVSGETADAVLREAGRYVLTHDPAVYDGRKDSSDASLGILSAPAGLMEVFYMMDPRPGERNIWRAVRSPIGGSGSLFVNRNVEEEGAPRLAEKNPAASANLAKGKDEKEAAPPPAEPERSFLSDFAVPLASDVLYLGFRFRTPATTTWREVPALKAPKPGEESGPTPWWDSTRAILDQAADRRLFTWKREEGSLDRPDDDVFPQAVEVTLVLNSGTRGFGIRLGDDITEGSMSFTVSDPLDLPPDPRDAFVLVDGEWMAVTGVDGRKVSVAAGGRGARGTRAAKHIQGSIVEVGSTFRRLVEIPGWREEPPPPEQPAKLKRRLLR